MTGKMREWDSREDVEKVFKPIGDVTLQQAEQSFRSEILTAHAIVANHSLDDGYPVRYGQRCDDVQTQRTRESPRRLVRDIAAHH